MELVKPNSFFLPMTRVSIHQSRKRLQPYEVSCMIDEMLQEAKELAGRDVEVIQLPSGLFIVEWFNYNVPPPPTGKSPLHALSLFIDYLKEKKKENPDAIANRATGEDSKEDESLSSPSGE